MDTSVVCRNDPSQSRTFHVGEEGEEDEHAEVVAEQGRGIRMHGTGHSYRRVMVDGVVKAYVGH